ncbi:MAG: PD-(D/E)XK nuclease family protein, partial [Clostridia bacterium]|nr:PD-(D/E)XK nuclease family protein [Clostridia bacterium]
IKKCLTPEGSVMLIGKVIAENRDNLQYYGKVALADGFASELYAALTAIRNSGITTEMLRAGIDSMSPSLRAKTNDIALIYDGYLEALSGRHSDSSTRLYALAEFIEAHPESVAGTHFYCTDIYEFSAPELAIIAGLAKNAMSLTVGVTSGYDNPNRRIYPDRVIAKLKAACPDRVQIERNDEELAPPVQAISTGLFSYRPLKCGVENGGKVELRRANDRYEEVLALALDVVERVRSGGRYKDFEVFVSDIADYAAEMKAVFSRYDIPFFIDKKEMFSEQTRVRYILDAIACVRSGFKRREVIDFVKNPLFAYSVNGTEESVFLFENYVLKYNIDRSRFFTEFTLKDEDKRAKRASNRGFLQKDAVAENEIPNAVRELLIETLAPLNIKGECNIQDFVAAVRGLLERSDKAWNAHVEKLTELSAYYQKCAEQVDKKLNAILDEIESVLSLDVDIARFESIFKAMLKTLKIALVPTSLDCVFVGDYDSRFMGAGDIYILGATNDKLPRASGGGSVLTPKDEEYFEKIGLDVTPNERQKLMTDMYAICDVMKKPHGVLHISYPESGGGTQLRPSTIIKELSDMLVENGAPIEIKRIDFDRLTRLGGDECAKRASTLFATEKSCYYEVLRNAVSGRAVLEERIAYGSAFECMAENDKLRLDGVYDTPERIELPDGAYFKDTTSVSRLETFFNCPYSHYFKYVLGLRKRKDGKQEGTENGTVLHYILEKFFSDVRDGIIKDAKDIKKKAYAYFDEAIRENNFEVLLEKADTGRLLRRVKEEGVRVCEDLYKIYQRSEFKPALLEAKIGEGKILPMSLKVGDRTVKLKGTIDRVDMCDDMFAVVDYKTYKSADLTLKELYYGQKIQLYIYMKAVEDSLNAKPVGVFYLPIFAGFTGEDANRYKFKGQVTNSESIMAKLDSVAEYALRESVIPYKLSRDRKSLSADVHLSRQAFDMLGDYAVRLAERGAKEIAGGYIKPSPVKDACKHCNYAEICAYRESNERKLGTAGMTSFENKMDESAGTEI